MNALSTHQTLHPVQWAAAISVTLLALTGIAAITGLLPSSKSAEPTIAPPAPAVAAAIPPVTELATTPVVAPAPKAIVKHTTPTEHRRHETVARAEAAPEPVVREAPPLSQPALCRDCGRIESVQRIAHEGEGSGLGAVAGGVLGGALGNGIGQGNGRGLATVAGIIGGAMLGNNVEKSRKQTFTYQTVVRLDDGSSRLFDNASEPAWRNGERVRIVNGSIQPD